MQAGMKLGPMVYLSEWAKSMKAFRRNKISIEKKIVAAGLCMSGYSYRQVSEMMGGMSHIAARDSYLALLTSMPRESKKFRREVEIDGNDFRVSQRTFHLWLARDVESGEAMVFHASPSGSLEDGSRFLAEVAAQCDNRPQLRLGYEASKVRGLANVDLYFQPQPASGLFGKLGRLLKGTA